MISAILSSKNDSPEASSWLESVAPRFSADEIGMLRHALDFSLPLYAGKALPGGEPAPQHVLGVAEILAALRVDCETLMAGILYAVPDYLDGYAEKLQAAFGPAVGHLVEGVARMGRIRTLGAGGADSATERGAQIEALRKMLLAMAEDIRVVIIALAARTQTVRYVVASNIPGSAESARETLDIFAPLANRLGLWQVKWELEDLSFRILEPERYQKIAALLEDSRAAREQHIALVTGELQRELQQAGISAEVSGRPKHIYSIHKKMKRKDVDFSEIHDARAVRILVDEVKDCYAALGVVHNLWTPIPKEFDDYIAKPKGNDYRSLHTAVIGPEGKVVEVQIRTHQMHQHSELGVAAHWRYKEGAKHDAKYEEKIAWLRQILEWKDDVVDTGADTGDLAEQFKTALFQDTVYVLTPQGRVVALPRGSTPLDFAYHVHTDLGHRCRGAKVNGVMVPLDTPLQNAQRVEIISLKQGGGQGAHVGPSRDWLNPALGYLKSHRAISKVRQWFNSQEHEATLAQGRAIVEKELQRHGMTALGLDKFAGKFKFDKLDDFLAAVARGDINSRQLAAALSGETEPAATEPELLVGRRTAAHPTGSGILIVGVDKLLTVLAKCCKPAPPDPIIGFVTRGRGITIHRQGCTSLSRLSAESAQRLIAADWGALKDASYPVDVEIEAQDRQGLLRDISDILSREKVNVTATNTQSHDVTATMRFTLEITGLEQLRRVLGLIQEVPGVVGARRR